MSTLEERAKNRERFRLYLLRHPEDKQRRIERAKAKRRLSPKPRVLPFAYDWAREPYRTYELVDPRDPEQLPHIISYCPSSAKPVWSLLWACRHYSHSRWAKWFRNLEQLGLQPVERTGWAVGKVQPLTFILADALVRARIRRVCRVVGCVPKWLYNAPRPHTVNRAIGCLQSDGRVIRYTSLRSARAASGFYEKLFQHYITTSAPAPDGSIWFDDGDC